MSNPHNLFDLNEFVSTITSVAPDPIDVIEAKEEHEL